MRNYSGVQRNVRFGAAAAALWLAVTGSVGAQAAVVTVAIFADHYVFAGKSFDDLDRLEDAVAAARPRGVRLEACGDGTARAQRAAAHRFRNLYLDLRVSYIDDTTCASAPIARAVTVSQRLGQRPYGIHDEAVDRWWSTISMP
mgnify:FL=1